MAEMIYCARCLKRHEDGLYHDKDGNLEPSRFVRLSDDDIARFDKALIASSTHLYDLKV